MGVKINERVIRYSLIFLILLSLYFSYNIWLSPIKPAGDETSNSLQTVVDEKSFRKADDTFLPLHLVWLQKDEIKQTNGEGISAVQGVVSEGSYGGLEKVVDRSEEEFNQYLDMDIGVELSYEAPFLLSEYIETFDLIFDRKVSEDFLFDRIQLDFSKNKIRFLSYKNWTIYEASMTINQDYITDILKNSTIRYTKMKRDTQMGLNQYYTDGAIKFKKYSYLVATQAYTVFRNNLFTDYTLVTSSSDTTKDVYQSGDEELTIDKNSQLVQFHAPLTEEFRNIYDQSFSLVQRFGNNLGNLRYFSRNNQEIDYRVFVEGFPVFGSVPGLAQVNVVVDSDAKEDTIHLETNSKTIQVPIPSDEEVLLPDTKVVWQNLENQGADMSLIQSIIVGYTWQDVKDDKGIVNLFPEWYVSYDSHWYSVDQLLAELPEMEVE